MNIEKIFICYNCKEPAAIRWRGFAAFRDDGEVMELCRKCSEALGRPAIFELMKKFGKESKLSMGEAKREIPNGGESHE